MWNEVDAGAVAELAEDSGDVADEAGLMRGIVRPAPDRDTCAARARGCDESLRAREVRPARGERT